MATNRSSQIICSACGEETILRREPVYDGFAKVGETLSCTGCGHRFASEEEITFKQAQGPRIFTEADKSRKVEIFSASDDLHNCRHCRHYVVNPFVQRCDLHQREVQATDCCDRFFAADKTDGKSKEDGRNVDPFAQLFDD